MPNIWLQMIDQLVENPSPEAGEITIVYRAWHAPGQYVGLNVHVNFNDTASQKRAKCRDQVTALCALEGVIVNANDKIDGLCDFAQL